MLEVVSVGSWRGLRPGFDAEARHNSVLAHLPAGTVRDWTRLQYITFLSPSNETVILAREWIDMTSVVENEAVTVVFTLTNQSRTNIEAYRQALLQNGAKAADIRTDIL